MKMAAIATAITTALVSGSALAAEVYNSDGTSLSIGGRAEFRGDFQGKANGDELKGTMDNASRFRVNVGGETRITDSLNGIGFYEAEQTVGNGEDDRNTGNTDFKQRYMYAGLVAGDNTITFGKQDAATVQISQMSDNVSTHSGIQKTYIAAGDEQINNALNYSGYFMDALSVKASLLAASGENQDGYALSAIYTLPFGLGVGLGYAANENDGSQDSTQFIGGLNYTWEGLYVAGTYTQGEGSKKYQLGDNDFTGYEFVAHYRFENNFQALVGYQKGEIDPANLSKFDISDYYELTGVYYFNKSLRTYATYKINNLEDADNSLRLALRYDF
ncbi:putative outer membrane protein [Vibrio maritimus]|uniref:Putative outer membrane protein n=1 Tax=Vibrio maritimus TaxID=990268 RepID=A0A090TBM6_9VIBR|nr:putative outer membrane protein [Vibrio maritimus]